jgi:hypothetical protein
MKQAYKVPKEGGSSIFKKYTWRVIIISLTYTLEESIEHGVGTRNMRYPEMIRVVELRIDLNPWIEGSRQLDVDYMWGKVSFSLTRNSKEGGALSFEIVKPRFNLSH